MNFAGNSLEIGTADDPKYFTEKILWALEFDFFIQVISPA